MLPIRSSRPVSGKARTSGDCCPMAREGAGQSTADLQVVLKPLDTVDSKN